MLSNLLFSGESNDQERKKAPSVSASVPPSTCTNLERTKCLALISRQEKEAPEDKTSKVTAVTLEFVDEEAQEREAALEVGQQKKPKKEKQVGLCDQEPKAKPGELTGASSSAPSHAFAHINSIVEKHLGHFSAEMQLVLQQESISYNYPESAQLPAESTAIHYNLPHRPISQFSQYVSFYNPCPPVQDYVSSLQDNIESMLAEMVDDWPPHKSASTPRNGDAALASKVSAFVSSIRASKEDLRDGEPAAADAGVGLNPASSREGSVWQHHAVEDLPDAAQQDTPAGPRAASSASSSINAAASRPPCVTLQAHLPLQSSPTSHSSRLTAENPISKTARCTNAPEREAILEQTNCGGNFGCASEPVAEPLLPAEPASGRSPAHAHVRSPPAATALSSLIRQLQPEVFDNLMDIIKDVRRNSVQFYLHSSEPGDQVYEDIKVRVGQQEALGSSASLLNAS